MSDQTYRPSGELQGDTKAMPDRGTGTGFASNPVTQGRSTDQDATNRIGSAASKSDDNTPPGEGK